MTQTAAAARHHLEKLTIARESITQVSSWFILHIASAEQCVEGWYEAFYDATSAAAVLPLLYVLSDVLMECKRRGKGNHYATVWGKKLPRAFEHVADTTRELVPKAYKILLLWQEHKLFVPEFLQVCVTSLIGTPSTPTSEPPGESTNAAADTTAEAAAAATTGDIENGDEVSVSSADSDDDTSASQRLTQEMINATKPPAAPDAVPASGSPKPKFEGVRTYQQLADLIAARKLAVAQVEWLQQSLQSVCPEVVNSTSDADIMIGVYGSDVAQRRVEVARRLVLRIQSCWQAIKDQETRLHALIDLVLDEQHTKLDTHAESDADYDAVLRHLQHMGRQSTMGRRVAKRKATVQVSSLLQSSAGEESLNSQDTAAAADGLRIDDPLAAEILANVALQEERERLAEEAAAAAARSAGPLFVFDSNAPDAGKDLVWNPVVRAYTRPTREDDWREH